MILKNISNIKVIELIKEKGNKHNLFLLLFISIFILINNSAFAIKPPPPVSKKCVDKTEQLQRIFDSSLELYNTVKSNQKIDLDSPDLDFDKVCELLKEKKYISDSFFEHLPCSKCKYSFKYIPEGTEKFPNDKQIIYCTFHGSEDAHVQCPDKRAVEYEDAQARKRFRIWRMLFYDFDWIPFVFLFFIIYIVKSFFGMFSKKNK